MIYMVHLYRPMLQFVVGVGSRNDDTIRHDNVFERAGRTRCTEDSG